MALACCRAQSRDEWWDISPRHRWMVSNFIMALLEAVADWPLRVRGIISRELFFRFCPIDDLAHVLQDVLSAPRILVPSWRDRFLHQVEVNLAHRNVFECRTIVLVKPLLSILC